jgi:hypothetical protein
VTHSAQASEKCRFKEVDYSQTLRETVYEQEEQINKIIREAEVVRTRDSVDVHCWLLVIGQARQKAQEHIQEQHRLSVAERERHMRDISEKTQQWEAALREREKQLSDFQKEYEVILSYYSCVYEADRIEHPHAAAAAGVAASGIKEECRWRTGTTRSRINHKKKQRGMGER